tara:strand:- start:229 stop:381 length:153 start_codon:yes stop_codon:yes gene_type:complete
MVEAQGETAVSGGEAEILVPLKVVFVFLFLRLVFFSASSLVEMGKGLIIL